MFKRIVLEAGEYYEPFSKLQLLTDIYSVRPELAAQAAYEPDSGFSNHVIIICEEVFKGPKSERDVNLLLREAGILQRLEGKKLHVRVPVVTNVSQIPPWFSMKLVKAVGMHKMFTGLSIKKQDAAARSIGLFMADLQKAFPVPEQYISNDAGPVTAKVREVLDRPEVKELLGPLLPVCHQAADSLGNFARVMTHGDLPSNILMDETTGDVNAIIDFGFAQSRLPQAAFSDLYRSFSPAFIDKVRIAYSGAQDQKIDRRDIILWDITHQIMMIPRHIQSGNADLLKQTIEKIGKFAGESSAALPAFSTKSSSHPKFN